MREKSGYLELFDKDRISLPYETAGEALKEAGNVLRLLLLLLEKRQAGAVSLEFAARDFALATFHRESRIAAGADSPLKSTAPLEQDVGEPSDPLCSIFKRLDLNAAEQTAFLLALADRERRLTAEEFPRLLERGRRAGLSLAEIAYRFQLELEGGVPKAGALKGREREILRPEKLSLFLRSGWQEDPMGREFPLVFRKPVADWLNREENEAFTGVEDSRNTAGHPGRRGQPEHGGTSRAEDGAGSGAGSTGSVYVHADLLARMKKMCADPGENWTMRLRGERGAGKEFLARHLAAFLGRELLPIDGSTFFEKSPAEREEWLLDLDCTCRLGAYLPYLYPAGGAYATVRGRLSGLLIVGAEEESDSWEGEIREGGIREDRIGEDRIGEEESAEQEGRTGRPGGRRNRLVTLTLPAPSAGEKALLWREFLKEYPHTLEISPEALGSRYVLNAGGIRRALYAASKWAAGNGRDVLSEEDIVWAVKQSQAGQLGEFAAPVPCVFDWDDLIVEEKVKTQLTYICGRLKYRSLVGTQWGFYGKMPYGRGLCALFYGPPGTGKTMAVQVVAKELGLELYRVDLSRMVSKYIGETEKNISALFEKAKHMNVILFFDEADAFFSRRSEVKDANDRSANAEVAHLLQKLEEYEGISILATNLKDNMDDAFKRRIQFMVNFRLPSTETRKKMWRSLLPQEAPRESDLDLDFFAEQFELSGSQIKEILLGAAFIAAGQGKAIGNQQVKEALSLNYEKYGKILTEKDFGYLR